MAICGSPQLQTQLGLAEMIDKWLKVDHVSGGIRISLKLYRGQTKWCPVCIIHDILDEGYVKYVDKWLFLPDGKPPTSASDFTEQESSLLYALVRVSPQGLFEESCPGFDKDCAHRCARRSPFNKAIQQGQTQLAIHMIDLCLADFNRNLAAGPRRRLFKLLESNDAVYNSFAGFARFYNGIHAEIVFENAKMHPSVVCEMILGRLQKAWALPIVQKGVSRLLENDAYLATEFLLVCIARYEAPFDQKVMVSLTRNHKVSWKFGIIYRAEEPELPPDRGYRSPRNVERVRELLLEDPQAAYELLLGNDEVLADFYRSVLNNDDGYEYRSEYNSWPAHKAHQTKCTIFTEDILRMTAHLRCEMRGYLAKKNKESILELPDIQPLWAEQKVAVQPTCELHSAVQRQDLELVDRLLQADPDSVFERVEVPTLDEADNIVSALWHNNYIVPQGPGPSKAERRSSVLGTESASACTRERIRHLLVSTMIERSDRMDTLHKLLREANEQFGIIGFDVPGHGLHSGSISERLRSLYGESDGDSHQPLVDRAGHLKFEKVLKYADFPSLDLGEVDADIKGVPKEVFHTLMWLRKWKGVEKILSLKVLDRMQRPHDERIIAYWACELGVKALDWRFLDMAISYFTESETEKRECLEELHLYSSGKRAAVDHWLGPNGVKTLDHLQTLCIHLVQDLIPASLLGRLRRMIENGVAHINKEKAEAGQPKIQLKFVLQPWNPSRTTAWQDDGDIAQRAVPDLHPYIKEYSNRVLSLVSSHERVRPTRIAILDSGIMDFWPQQGGAQKANSLRARIADGSTFVHNPDRMPPWQFSSDPHGTQIANLICAIDPHCEIYIAKVAEGRHGILPDNVAEAISWAISKDVDIISMSFAIPQPAHNSDPRYAEKLKRAVLAAHQADIIQFCSHDDEGWNNEKSWPADCGYVKIVAACNEFGRFTNQKPRKYHYQIPGFDIFTGAVPGLNSGNTMSGSSVATAIATGMSSLTLSCYRLANDAGSAGPSGRMATIEQEIANMSKAVNCDLYSAETPRYLRPRDFSKFANSEKDGKFTYGWLLV